MSEAFSITVSGRNALVYEETMEGRPFQTFILLEEGDSTLLFVIYSGDIYNEGEPVIEELEAFFVDVEIVE